MYLSPTGTRLRCDRLRQKARGSWCDATPPIQSSAVRSNGRPEGCVDQARSRRLEIETRGGLPGLSQACFAQHSPRMLVYLLHILYRARLRTSHVAYNG